MEITAQVLKELELFNRGRTSDKGVLSYQHGHRISSVLCLVALNFPSPHSLSVCPYVGSDAGCGFGPCFFHAAELQCAVGDR